MKNKLAWFLITVIAIISSVLVSCNTTQTTNTTPSTVSSNTTPITTPATASTTQAHWWDKLGTPQYGGTIIQRVPQNFDFAIWDPGDPRGGAYNDTIYDKLFVYDMTVDPSIHPYTGEFVEPKYIVGQLAASWSMADPKTLVVKLRQGVHWANSPPTNGREFVADDVVYNFNRVIGAGEFKVPDPFFASQFSLLQSIAATDKYTVQFALKTAGDIAALQILGGGQNELAMGAPEWIKQYGTDFSSVQTGPPGGGGGGPPGGGPPGGGAPGGAPGGGPSGSAAPSGNNSEPWKVTNGSGPWMITDVVSGTSATFSKNPNYWGTDPRYPQNKMPYADNMKFLIIPDNSTALAALRTGKVDLMNDSFSTPTWQEAAELAKTNPEIKQSVIIGGGPSVTMRCDTKPFTDIRVRQALEMSINRADLAKGVYGGIPDGIPIGIINPINKGFAIPFSQWPSDVQQLYTYNPAKAKQLLSDAGYPNGFKTDVVTSAAFDSATMLAFKSYFSDINVDMTINVLDQGTFFNTMNSGKFDQLLGGGGGGGGGGGPWGQITDLKTGGAHNSTFNNDLKYDAFCDQINNTTDIATVQQICQQADLYAAGQCWFVSTFPIKNYLLWQPWVGGYLGETSTASQGYDTARLWIDQSKKK